MLVATAVALPAWGSAMTVSGRDGAGACHVNGGDKLPSAVGSDSLCAAVTRAIAAQAPNARFAVEVTVVNPAMLRATLTVDGHMLPAQSFAVMDRNLDSASIDRFANAVAAAVAQAARS